jgi:hypothetical protein
VWSKDLMAMPAPAPVTIDANGGTIGPLPEK